MPGSQADEITQRTMVMVSKERGHGYGLYAAVTISKDELIDGQFRPFHYAVTSTDRFKEYVGEVIDGAEAARRE